MGYSHRSPHSVVGKRWGERLRRLVSLMLASAALMSCASTRQGKSIAKVVRQSGFSPVNPPADYIHPGTIILLESRNPLEVSVVCTAETALGEVELLESDTANLAFLKAEDHRLNLRLRQLGKLIAHAKLRHIAEISVIIKNPQVFEIPDAAVIAGLEKRTEECKGAIRLRERSRKRITMVKKALFAERVEGEITFHRAATFSAKESEILEQEVAGELGLEQAGGGILYGNNLYWGIVDDPDLVATDEEASLIVLGYGGSRSRQRQRAIPIHAMVNLSPRQ